MAKKKKQNSKATDPKENSKKTGPGLISQLSIAFALGCASFATVFFLPDRTPEQPQHHEEEAEKLVHSDDISIHPEELNHVEMEALTLTLGDFERLLKIGITLEVVNAEEVYIDPADPQYKDAFTGYLRSLRLEQLKDPGFMIQMRAHLLRRAKLVFGEDLVHGILITDFLVR